MNVMNAERGTAAPTNSALLTPMKNISTSATRKKPRMMVLIRSLRVVRVFVEVSPNVLTLRFSGRSSFCIRSSRA